MYKPFSKGSTKLSLEGPYLSDSITFSIDFFEEIFNEKINDNQLTSSPLTLQEIQIIKDSFQESIEGLYHQRVLYIA